MTGTDWRESDVKHNSETFKPTWFKKNTLSVLQSVKTRELTGLYPLSYQSHELLWRFTGIQLSFIISQIHHQLFCVESITECFYKKKDVNHCKQWWQKRPQREIKHTWYPTHLSRFTATALPDFFPINIPSKTQNGANGQDRKTVVDIWLSIKASEAEIRTKMTCNSQP